MDKCQRDPLLSIVIVSYNTREMALSCIRSVFAETINVSFEIIVLDNDSADGSCEAITKEINGKVELIRSSTNLGFAGGNNRAILDAKGEIILLLNPDTLILDSAIDRLISFAEEHPEADIWRGRTLFADFSLNRTSCLSKQSIWCLV